MKNQAWLWWMFSSNRQISDVGVSNKSAADSNAGKYSYSGDSASISSIGFRYDTDNYPGVITRVNELGSKKTLQTATSHLLGRVG